MKSANLLIIQELNSFLEQAMYHKEEYCQRVEDFSRKSILGFTAVVYFLLNLSKRSLALELDSFFDDFMQLENIPTKGAFSQIRYKLRACFFQDWNNTLIEKSQHYQIYQNNWLGFTLIGIDGTTLQLPDTEVIKAEFGLASNQSVSYPMARALCAYDVLNHLCVLSKISSITTHELTLALEFAGQLPENSLSIYDRGLASFALIHQLINEEKSFLIRCSVSFNKEIKAFVKSKRVSLITDIQATNSSIKRLEALGIKINKKTYVKVRLINVKLESGETEVLITSLTATDKYPTRVFKKLYFYR